MEGCEMRDALRRFDKLTAGEAQGLRRDEGMGVKRDCPLNTRKWRECNYEEINDYNQTTRFTIWRR